MRASSKASQPGEVQLTERGCRGNAALFYDHHTAQREATRKLDATSRIVHRKLATRWGTELTERDN